MCVDIVVINAGIPALLIKKTAMLIIMTTLFWWVCSMIKITYNKGDLGNG